MGRKIRTKELSNTHESYGLLITPRTYAHIIITSATAPHACAPNDRVIALRVHHIAHGGLGAVEQKRMVAALPAIGDRIFGLEFGAVHAARGKKNHVLAPLTPISTFCPPGPMTKRKSYPAM